MAIEKGNDSRDICRQSNCRDNCPSPPRPETLFDLRYIFLVVTRFFPPLFPDTSPGSLIQLGRSRVRLFGLIFIIIGPLIQCGRNIGNWLLGPMSVSVKTVSQAQSYLSN